MKWGIGFGSLVAVVVASASCSGSGGSEVTAPSPGTTDGGPGSSGGDVNAADAAALDASADPDAPTGDGSADAGSWTPKQLSGLSLWLDDKVGIVMDPAKPGRVKRWLDQSGKGNHAEGSGGDGVVSTPLLDPSAVGAGLDAVQCDRQTSLVVASTQDLRFRTGDWAIVTVARVNVSPALAPSARILTRNDLEFTVTPERTLKVFVKGIGGGSAALAEVPTTMGYQIFVARGKALEVRAAGKVGTGPTTTLDADANSVTNLCTGVATDDGPGTTWLAEMIVVKGTLSDADLAMTETYLKAKFGL